MNKAKSSSSPKVPETGSQKGDPPKKRSEAAGKDGDDQRIKQDSYSDRASSGRKM